MSVRIFVPGRIEVLGKHTDYAGGSSLLLAVDRGFTFEAEPRADDRIVFVAEATGEAAAYDIVREGEVARAVAASAAGGAGSRADASTHGGAGSPPASNLRPAPGQSHGAGGRRNSSSGRDGEPAARPGWARYIDGLLARTLAEFGDGACGARISFRSTLPAAAGLSSSSALVTGAFLALDAVCRFSALPSFRRTLPDRHALAGLLSSAEMGGPVGTRGGSEDHVAILCAQPRHIVRYGLAPIRFRGAAPVPDGWTFAVGASGVVADKGGAVQANYNRLSDLAVLAARAWSAGRGLSDEEGAAARNARVRDGARALDVAEDEGEADRAFSLGDALEQAGSADDVLAAVRRGAHALGEDPEPLIRRARHFFEESSLVDAAFEALARGDVHAFAAAANRSADAGAELLGNQVPETLRLTELARTRGAAAASPFGGGFGGAVWALVREADAVAFVAEWRERYRAAFPERHDAVFFATAAGGPAEVLSSDG
jgi:galactokinase